MPRSALAPDGVPLKIDEERRVQHDRAGAALDFLCASWEFLLMVTPLALPNAHRIAPVNPVAMF